MTVGAFMERSGRNRWQSTANHVETKRREHVKTVAERQRRCRNLVRKASALSGSVESAHRLGREAELPRSAAAANCRK